MWAFDFKTRQYLKGSLWFLPLLGGIAGALLAALEPAVARRVSLPDAFEYSAATASSLLAAIVGATAALTGFVVTVSVLVVQMATSNFSARYMRLWYRDRVLHILLAMLVGTFTFSFTLLAGVEQDSVPSLGVTVTGALMAADLFLFLVFLDRFVHRLRPVAVAALAAAGGKRAFEALVHAADGPQAPEVIRERPDLGGSPTNVIRTTTGGSIQAIDTSGLVRAAREHESTIVLQHVVGDFVPAGAAVIHVHGAGADNERSQSRLRGMIVLGVERTIDQDPAFAVRIMVDVAIKALSPAVNDPTTAVQVINHLGDLLHVIGATDFRRAPARDGRAGRVLIRARGWEQYLALGVTEIRDYGAPSVQVARRLRAMLEELHDVVRPEHRLAVEDELARLEAAVTIAAGASPDLDRALMSDRQGLGGVPAFAEGKTPEP